MRQKVVSKCAELPQVILQSSVLSQRSQIFLFNLVFLLEIFLSKQTAGSFFFTLVVKYTSGLENCDTTCRNETELADLFVP